MTRTARTAKRSSGWWTFGTLLLLAALVAFAATALMGHGTERGLIIGPLVLLLATPLIRSARRSERGFDLAGIIYAAVAAKLLASLARFEMVQQLYNGVGDSTSYHQYGELFAPRFRSFDFAIDPGAPVPGTGFIRVLTGIVYAVFGTDRFGGFLLFSMLAFLGCWFFYRAFVLAVPDGNHKRYAVLIFFWPSLVFWPSAVGKEAWMIFALGLTSYGAAALYQHRARAFPLLALGITAAAMPRPHIAIVVLASVAAGLVVGSLVGSQSSARSLGFITRGLGVLFLVVAGAMLAPKVATFLNIDDVGGSGFAQTRDEVIRTTSQGGSEFTPAVIESPLDYPWAFITVLLRPFPFEARNLATMVSAAEGMLLAVLLGMSIRQLVRLPVSVAKHAHVAYAASFAFMFCYVFAFIGNFGILARQRAQLLPFLFVILAAPLARRDEPEPEVDEIDLVTPRRTHGHSDVERPRSTMTPALSPPRARRRVPTP